MEEKKHLMEDVKFFQTFRYPVTLRLLLHGVSNDKTFVGGTFVCPSCSNFEDFLRDCLLVLPVDPQQPFEWTNAECTDAKGHTCLKVQKDFPAQPSSLWSWTVPPRPRLTSVDANSINNH